MKNKYYIYILSGTSDIVQIGVTRNPEQMLHEQTEMLDESFLDAKLMSKIVYLEKWDDRYIAGAREEQLKHLSRKQLVKLVEEQNPEWNNLLKISA